MKKSNSDFTRILELLNKVDKGFLISSSNNEDNNEIQDMIKTLYEKGFVKEILVKEEGIPIKKIYSLTFKGKNVLKYYKRNIFPNLYNRLKSDPNREKHSK